MADYDYPGTLSVTGNVGIGTEPLPNAQLYIRSTTKQSQILVENSSGALLKLSVDTNKVALGPDTGTKLPLSFQTNGVPRLSINSTGLVNIAESLIIHDALSVSGNVVIEGVLNFSENQRQFLSFSNGKNGIGVQDNTQYFRTTKNFAWYQSGTHTNLDLNPGTNGKLQMSINESGDLSVSNTLNVGKNLSINGKVGIGTSEPQSALEVRGDIRGNALDINGLIKGAHLEIAGPIASQSLGFHFIKAKEWDYLVDNKPPNPKQPPVESITMITHRFKSPLYPIKIAVFAHAHALVNKGTLHVPIQLGIDGKSPVILDPFKGDPSHTWGWGTALIRTPQNSLYPIQATAYFTTEPNKQYTIEWRLIARSWTESAGKVSAPTMFIFRSALE